MATREETVSPQVLSQAVRTDFGSGFGAAATAGGGARIFA